MRAIRWRNGAMVIVDLPPPVVSRRQARLALGEAACAVLDAAIFDPQIPWAMRETMRSATEWPRHAQEIDELKWLLGLSDEQIDQLFAVAVTL